MLSIVVKMLLVTKRSPVWRIKIWKFGGRYATVPKRSGGKDEKAGGGVKKNTGNIAKSPIKKRVLKAEVNKDK